MRYQNISCNNFTCPQKPEVRAQWSSWSPCSTSCGAGTRWQARNVTTLSNNTATTKREYQTEPCNNLPTQQCAPANLAFKIPPTDYGQWGEWSGCSATCGGGAKHRARNVTVFMDPVRSYTTLEVAPEPCNPDPCSCKTGTELSEWSDWNACPVTCGGGVQYRIRNSTLFAACKPVHNHVDYQTRMCQQVTCAPDYGEW